VNGGFPPGVEFTPIPNPLLARWLEEVDDLNEIKVTLRAIWLLHRKKGSPRPLRPDELSSDRTISAALKMAGAELEEAIRAALDQSVRRGVLLRARPAEGPEMYFLNTETERRAIARWYPAPDLADRQEPRETWPVGAPTAPRSRVFAVYEENIGPLTPILAERLAEAQAEHGDEWVIDAISVAVENNARRWSYAAAVLDRWANEGRDHGELLRRLHGDCDSQGSDPRRVRRFRVAVPDELRAPGAMAFHDCGRDRLA
jgi:DNA replication protein